MLPSIRVLLFYMLECGISRSGARVYLILIDSVRFLSRKAVTAFYDRTVPKSQMARFVHKLLNSYSEKRGNHTYKKKGQPWNPSSGGKVYGLLECAAGNNIICSFGELVFDGCDVKVAEKMKTQLLLCCLHYG